MASARLRVASLAAILKACLRSSSANSASNSRIFCKNSRISFSRFLVYELRKNNFKLKRFLCSVVFESKKKDISLGGKTLDHKTNFILPLLSSSSIPLYIQKFSNMSITVSISDILWTMFNKGRYFKTLSKMLSSLKVFFTTIWNRSLLKPWYSNHTYFRTAFSRIYRAYFVFC